ncbi:cytochrome-c oxidase, cbb3-type subunit III [Euryhalocaulis caribicus]|uniref:cytochrome-c oxidase, cbb3-type subunit III n=1 Tax=Euryhalocaulis caribicus TaxID=1161401 RepID=UPI00039F5F03|nr:cytochrome-c oxidase, cbb3-type subunit III [Euryhalocaulis caribicus]
MGIEERDPVSGRKTTGHEWNGIKELDTPVPRGVLIFLIVTHVFAVICWFLLPAWPLGSTFTKGILETDQREIVEEKLVRAAAERASWMERIESATLKEIQADEQLMSIVNSTGHQLFGDNCAACHGVDGKGRANYPDLTDEDWLWGGSLDAIANTMRVGINTDHPEAQFAIMPSFGRDGILDRDQVRSAAAYVYSLSNPDYSTADNIDRIATGRNVYLSSCASCHGEDARGSQRVGAPNLTDQYWIYGGDLQTIVTSVHGGRQGHMPTWDERLTEAEIKILTLYVNSLQVEDP